MSFLEFYNSFLNTIHTSTDDLPFSVEKVHFKKGDIITEYGQVESAIYFMNNGIVEMTIKSYISEKIVDFFFNKDIFCGYTSFLNQLPTDVQIVALTDCEMEMIDRQGWFTAFETSFEANKFGRIATQNGYIRKSNREKDFLTKTAEERYAEMFRTHSRYIANVSGNKIAKYLGIHPESLSRIRKKMNS